MTDFVSGERDWDRVNRLLKTAPRRADVTYEELARRFREHGFEETKVSVANKLSRGTFPATFFVAVIRAIGRENFNLADL